MTNTKLFLANQFSLLYEVLKELFTQIEKLATLFNQRWLTRQTVTDLNPDELRKLRYYPFMVSLDKCDEVVILLMIYLHRLWSAC